MLQVSGPLQILTESVRSFPASCSRRVPVVPSPLACNRYGAKSVGRWKNRPVATVLRWAFRSHHLPCRSPCRLHRWSFACAQPLLCLPVEVFSKRPQVKACLALMVAGLPASRPCHPEPTLKRHEGRTPNSFCEVRRRRNTRDFRTTWKVKNSPGL